MLVIYLYFKNTREVAIEFARSRDFADELLLVIDSLVRFNGPIERVRIGA